MIGIASRKRDDLFWLLYHGINYHSHLGSNYGGVALFGNELITRIHSIKNSSFATEFGRNYELFNGEGKYAIGAISDQAQPVLINPINIDLGIFSIAIHGNVDNADNLVVGLLGRGLGFDYDVINGKQVINHAKLIGRLISEKESLLEGIKDIFEKVEGSVSILIMSPRGIYAARTKHGHTTLTIGYKEGTWIVASETNGFANLGIRIERMLGPGEIVLMTGEGIEILSKACLKCQFCPFFMVYRGDPGAEYYGQSPEKFREKMGELMARKDFDSGFLPDFYASMADSGTPYGIGYGNGTIDNGAPVKNSRIFIKNFSHARNMSLSQQDRNKNKRHKWTPIRDICEMVQDKDVVLNDDSWVRGEELKLLFDSFTRTVLHNWGLKLPNFHVRFGSPVIGWRCPYLGTIKSCDELASRKTVAKLLQINVEDVTDDIFQPYMVHGSEKYNILIEAIRQDLGVASVVFPTLEEMISLTGLPESDLCTYCWTGKGV